MTARTAFSLLRAGLLAAAATTLAACESITVAGIKPDGEFATASVPPSGPSQPLGMPQSDLQLGKSHFREQNFGLAEQHFRRAVEARPNDPEAWLGLAASYDQLRRFDLADKAYTELFKLTGPTAESLNNRGYSYLMRGDYTRARADLAAALKKDPENQLIRNNLDALKGRNRAA